MVERFALRLPRMSVPNSEARRLVVATSNLGKIEEIRTLLDGQPVIVARPEDLLGYRVEVVEDGETFQQNAEIKARRLAAETGLLTLADDSGLEVDALGGQPGVRSARFAGEKATDADNNAELLRRLAGVESEGSSARFRCAMALFDPARKLLRLADASCEGRIIGAPRGTGGFGYDPLFEVAEYGTRTMAELSMAEKNRISHRGKALRAMLPWILQALSVR